MSATAKSDRGKPTIGWREWVALPDLGVTDVKAKVDTGARSSSLHAFDVERYEVDGVQMVRFKVHPLQRRTDVTVTAEALLLDERIVRDSGGKETLRPVVETTVNVAGREVAVELTLASRDAMGFRMLLGRQAVRDRFLVDPGLSFLGNPPPRLGVRRGKVKTKKPKREARAPKAKTTAAGKRKAGGKVKAPKKKAKATKRRSPSKKAKAKGARTATRKSASKKTAAGKKRRSADKEDES